MNDKTNNLQNNDNEMPLSIASRVICQKTSLYIDRGLKNNAVLKSWVKSCHRNGANYDIIECDLDEILAMKESQIEANPDARNKALDDLKIRSETLNIIEDSSKYNASDIHMLIRPEFTEIQLRINNELRVYKQYTQEMGELMSRAIIQGLAKSRDASYMPGEFQGAQISGDSIKYLGLTSIRVARGPAFPQEDGGGFSVQRLQYDGRKKHENNFMPVLEYPKKPDGKFTLGEQGYNTLQMNLLDQLMSMPEGSVFVSGPTGSGKTTTMYQMLMHLAREYPYKRQVTIEDPVEYPMSWAVQLSVTNTTNGAETGDAFAKCLRIGLRINPNIIFVGEIRDKEVALVALEAAITGHQVWATIHVNDPFNTINRLENMDNIALNKKITCDHTQILGFIAQRLVIKICQHCAQPLSDHMDFITPEIYENLITWHGGDFSKAKVRMITRGGDPQKICKKCNGDGVAGRMAIAEVVVTSAELMEDYINHGTETARKNHRMRSGSDKSILGNAIEYIRLGLIDPRDVKVTIGPIVKYKEGL